MELKFNYISAHGFEIIGNTCGDYGRTGGETGCKGVLKQVYLSIVFLEMVQNLFLMIL
jgi:hypothetical protein